MSQLEQILTHLKSGKPITAIEALNRYGCFRLAARIYDLRVQGHDIKSDSKRVNGKEIARYSL